MQSTGQTSTHERSLVLMHGSAIMYVIQHLHCQWTNSSYEWGPPVVNWTSRLRVFADGDGILCAEGCAMARIVETPPVPDRRFDIAGYDAIDTAALETFPYEYPGRDVAVDIETDEFTAVCPWSGLPDFGVVAAIDTDVTMVLKPLSYGPLQLRVAEILKPLVIWEPHLIPAFVIGNFLSNLTSPFSGPWELIFMPTANLVGASLCRVV